AGNLTTVDYPSSADITLQYDAGNRLTNMVDAAGTTRYSYADFGALASEDGPWENDTVSYGYNNRRRSSLALQQPNAAVWSQTYAARGQLKTALRKEPGGLTNRWHEQFTYPYEEPGNLTNRIQNKLTNASTLNSLNQLTGGSRGGRFTVAATTTSPATNVTVNT